MRVSPLMREREVRVLDFLNSRQGRKFRYTEIVEGTGLKRSVVDQIVNRLVREMRVGRIANGQFVEFFSIEH